MRAVIICGGEIKDYEYTKKQIRDSDMVICADSGYDHAVRMRLYVSVVVGDFDSVESVPDDVETIKYPPRKNLTDSEIAIKHARGMGFKDFMMVGATGARMDHTLTNILMLKSFMERGETCVIIDEHNKIMMTESKLDIFEPPGATISLIPLTDCAGVTTTNLEYPLVDADMFVGKGLGVSNKSTDAHSVVSIKSGTLLVVVAND